jgi:hypothetical protein
MNTLRRRAKQVSQEVVSSGGLPVDAVRETRSRSSWASISVLQDAMETLQGILSHPAKQQPKQFDSLVSSTTEVTSTMPKPTRPTTAKDTTSRPVSRAASRSMAALQFSESSMPESEPRAPSAAKAPLKALAQLPPVTPPRKGIVAAPPRAESFLASAMDLDLGDGPCNRTGTPPQQKRQSRSLTSHRVTKDADSFALPALVGGKSGANTSFGAKSMATKRTGSVGPTLWGHSPLRSESEWNSRPLGC